MSRHSSRCTDCTSRALAMTAMIVASLIVSLGSLVAAQTGRQLAAQAAPVAPANQYFVRRLGDG